MNRTTEEKSFGEVVHDLRSERNWTIKELLGRMVEGDEFGVTPGYITRVEQYGEIPSPKLICRLADVFGVDQNELLKLAKETKVRKFDESLGEKYRKAAGLYRTERKGSE